MATTVADGGSGRLQGKVAIVTGAARRIGRATAVALARAGADVMGMDIAGPVSSTLESAAATRYFTMMGLSFRNAAIVCRSKFR
jgi:NAD(P)-dependent dehydrogenase (short-subunit alcohol dehydrogenase family)